MLSSWNTSVLESAGCPSALQEEEVLQDSGSFCSGINRGIEALMKLALPKDSSMASGMLVHTQDILVGLSHCTCHFCVSSILLCQEGKHSAVWRVPRELLGGNFIFSGDMEGSVMGDDVWRDIWTEEGLVKRACPLGIARFEGILPKPLVHREVVGKHPVPVALLTCEVMK